MNKIDLTYGGKLQTLVNGFDIKNLDINFTIDGETGKATTTSILIDGDKDNFLMITFDYQELKEIIESREDIEELHNMRGEDNEKENNNV